MPSKILDPRRHKNLQPATSLWNRYRPEAAPLRFKARSIPAARRWQTATRRELARTINLKLLQPVPPQPRRVELVDRGDYVREKIVIRTSAHTEMPVYVLKPAGARGRLPVVLALHGHGYGVKDIVGLWEDGTDRDSADGYHKDFGVALCRAGFLVAAPEISCFGERQTDFSKLGFAAPQPSTCGHTAFLSFHLGASVIGLRVYDAMRLVDYLATRRDTDMKRLGAMGISGGGMHTFFSTCLDPRIRACVISGYYCTFRDSVLAMSHCPCNFVPGLWRFGEMQDLVGLIAPRPVLVEAGDHDHIFPISAVRKAVSGARSVYGVFNAREAVQTDYFEGRHQISGEKAYGFLKAQLGA
ncbi:MAG: acetylxylan esterase [Phycisphaeraceae bacterium]|nr:acetylxylan esterase [Phycisphaeraceae bacterium]